VFFIYFFFIFYKIKKKYIKNTHTKKKQYKSGTRGNSYASKMGTMWSTRSLRLDTA
jgi:hypothetical protein